jgi:processive 1,2-diacylglycerol beta-glucosyltransferase
MRSNLRILALQRESHVARGVPSLSVAARITEMLDYLQYHDKLEYISVDEHAPEVFNALEWAEVLIMSKHASLAALALARQARRTGKKVVYDFDDWIFSFPKYSGGMKHKDKTPLIQEILSHCTHITVANLELQIKLRSLVGDTVLLPNGMWIEKYRPNGIDDFHIPRTNRIVFTNADFIKLNAAKELFLTALQIFFLKHPFLVMDFYGDPFPELVSLPFIHFIHRIPYDQYIRSLTSNRYLFAITPLGADEDPEASSFNECKNPFKYLNYAVAGTPGLYSSSPVYKNVIENGKTGLIVENTLNDWTAALEMFLCEPLLRRQIIAQSMADVSSQFHIKAAGEIFLDLLRAS